MVNHLRATLRGLSRRRGYSFILIVGLAVGLAGCLLIGLYVADEAAFDRQHEQADRIARVTFDFATPTTERALAMVGPTVGPDLVDSVPEIVDMVRVREGSLWLSNPDSPEARYQEGEVIYADASLLDVFTFPLGEGHADTALDQPFSMILTPESAQRYFRESPALGRALESDGTTYTVTGVLAESPRQGHLPFEFVVSMSTLESTAPDLMAEWWALVFNTYVQIDHANSMAGLAPKLDQYLQTRIGDSMELEGHRFALGLQPLAEVYFSDSHHSSLARTGSRGRLAGFTVAAILILIIAGANFVNLATARAAERAREVGVRKATGALQSQLAAQFLAESVLLTVFAAALGILIAHFAMPLLTELSGKPLTLAVLMKPDLMGYAVGAVLVVGLLAGLYPAVVLSRFDPVRVLRGLGPGGRNGAAIRKALVTGQFALSIALALGTGAVHEQLSFMQGADLGFDGKGVIALNFHRDAQVQRQLASLKASLLLRRDVESVSVSGDIPGRGNLHASLTVENAEGEPHSAPWRFVAADPDYLSVLGVPTVAGRPLSADRPSDQREAAMLNEAAVRELGFASPEEAIGANFSHGDHVGVVIGVMKDFHLKSLREHVEPVYVLPAEERYSYLVLRLNTDDVQRSLSEIEAVWAQGVPHRPFDFTFLDDSMSSLYVNEARMGRVVTLFAVLAALVAGMGLFGLASLLSRRRTREIGVRKILGASPATIVRLVTRETLVLVVVGFTLAAPVVYLLATEWMGGFAYQPGVGFWLFVRTGLAALGLAALCTAYEAIRAASSSPVLALRED